MMQAFISRGMIRGWVCLILLPVLFLGTVAARAESASAPQSLAARIEKACAEKNVDDRLSALANVGGTLSLAEVPEALQAAENLKQLREHMVFGEAVLNHWGELAPAEAFEHIAKLPEGMLKLRAIHSVAPAYASKDVQAAVAAAMKMTPGRCRDEAVALIAETWARTDAKAAIQWARDLPEGLPTERAIHNIYFIWVHRDPAGFSSAVFPNLPPGETRSAMVINVAGDWAAQDPASAVKWAQGLPQQEERETALATVAESWADADPVAASDFAMKLSPPELRQRAVLAVVDRWATQNPEQVFWWTALQCRDEALQVSGIRRVLNLCVPVCPEAAAKWVDQLTSPPLRENAIGVYAEAVYLWNPEAGARLAFKSGNPAEREKRVERCFRQWLAWEPERAKAWLKETSFPEEVKARWLTPPAAAGESPNSLSPPTPRKPSPAPSPS